MKALDIKIDEMYQAWTLRGMKDNIEERTVMLMTWKLMKIALVT